MGEFEQRGTAERRHASVKCTAQDQRCLRARHPAIMVLGQRRELVATTTRISTRLVSTRATASTYTAASTLAGARGERSSPRASERRLRSSCRKHCRHRRWAGRKFRMRRDVPGEGTHQLMPYRACVLRFANIAAPGRPFGPTSRPVPCLPPHAPRSACWSSRSSLRDTHIRTSAAHSSSSGAGR